MKWFENSGTESNIVLFSRVRIARNLDAYPFTCKLSTPEKERLNQILKTALDPENELSFLEMKNLSKTEIVSLAEKFFISPEFASSPSGRALLLSKDEDVSIMLMEEEHVKIRSILPGLCLEDAFKNAQSFETKLENAHRIAFNGTLGYLTRCPTNIGTAMRASIMLHLPALVSKGEIAKLSETVSRLGIILRPAFSDKGVAIGNLFTLSNRVTLGISEETAIKNLSLIANQIVSREKKARENIENDDILLDKIMRAYGILKNAHLLSASEFANLVSLVRLGASEGLIALDVTLLTKLFVEMQSATLLCFSNESLSLVEKEKLRAKKVRECLA